MIRFPTAFAAVLVAGALGLAQQAFALGEYKFEYATVGNGSAFTTSSLYQVSARINAKGTHSTKQDSTTYSVAPVESTTAAPSRVLKWSLY